MGLSETTQYAHYSRDALFKMVPEKKKVFESIKIVLLIVSMETTGCNYSRIFQRLRICSFIF